MARVSNPYETDAPSPWPSKDEVPFHGGGYEGGRVDPPVPVIKPGTDNPDDT